MMPAIVKNDVFPPRPERRSPAAARPNARAPHPALPIEFVDPILGEVFVQLGCGGGADVIRAARAVGATGRAIGVDPSLLAIERAIAHALRVGRGSAPSNTSLLLAAFDALPLPNDAVDCVLALDPPALADPMAALLRETFRVLRPGGRFVMVTWLPRSPLSDAAAEVDLILTRAGFVDVHALPFRVVGANWHELTSRQPSAPIPLNAAEVSPRSDITTETGSACVMARAWKPAFDWRASHAGQQ